MGSDAACCAISKQFHVCLRAQLNAQGARKPEGAGVTYLSVLGVGKVVVREDGDRRVDQVAIQ